MYRQTRKTNGQHRILAVLLSLLMLFQTVCVYAESPDPAEVIQETTELPEGKEEVSADQPDIPEEKDEVQAGNSRIPEGNADIPPENGELVETENTEQGETAAEPTPVIDTSESVTMFMPGFMLKPAYFEGTLIHNGPDYTVTAVIGKDAMLPADVSMRVAEVLPGTELYEFYREMMAETLEEDEEMGEFARLFDIAFIAVIDGEETEIEPAADIDVQITFLEAIAVTEEIDVQAVHFEENTPEVMDVSTDSLAAAADDDEAIDTLSFTSDSFSIYGFFQKVKKVIKVITASGETFAIDVSFTSDSGIPDDAELTTTEITPDDPEYEAYRAQALATLAAGDSGNAFFFDIRISKDGEKIEPQGPVTVTIALDEMPEETAEVAVVHFGKEATEVIEGVAVSESDIQFQAESFSVYGVVVSPGPATANNLNNCSATISIGGYYMTAIAGNAGDGTAGLAKSDNAADAVFWTFESTGQERKYYIYTWVGEEKRYLNIAASGNGASANATLGSNRQEMTVQYNNNGTYTIYSQSQNNDYYLIQYNGTGGNVFACWNSGASTNPDAQMTFTFNSQNEPGQNYMMLVQYQGGYYIVHNDGALEQVDYRTETQEVRVDNPMLWRYTGDHVYHHSMQAGYDWSSLPSDFYYRYINPTDESALSEDDATNTQTDGTESQWGAGPKIVVRDLMKDTRLEYTGNHKLRSASNPEYYIGVKEENGVLRLCGKADAENAVTVLFADAAYVSHPYWNEHAVNHIDISVVGTGSLDIPVAYGKYYDENGNVVLEVNSFQKLHLGEDQIVDGSQLAVTPDDMKRSSINAYLANGTNLDNAFYIDGYSANSAHEETSAQVRIEGSFKVANLPPVDIARYYTDPDYKADIHNSRLANQVYYSVTVTKPVTFWMQVPDENDPSRMIQLYDENGEPLKVTADLAFSGNFSYWDKDNVCPPIHDEYYNYKAEWERGGIPDHNISGMDFKLDGSADVNLYAIEITKLIVDENGNRIKSSSAGTNRFFIYSKTDTDGGLSVKDLNIGEYTTETPELDQYELQHEKLVKVGNDGLGLVYDYNVAAPALYYIQEDQASIQQQITDTSGQAWNYKQTYMLTEYAWRNHVNDNYMHMSDTYSDPEDSYISVPEILGDHRDYFDPEKTYTNDFLEFFVYNVYEAPKTDVPVEKTWPDFDTDDAYDWSAAFQLQWAPLYPDETVPSISFQNVVPLQNITITKNQMKDETAREASLTSRTFKDLPKYGTDANGRTFRYQYSLEETSYRVTNSTTGVILYSWSTLEGYNDPDENTHYQPFYIHIAGNTDTEHTDEENADDSNYYIQVRNMPQNIRAKEHIDVSLTKKWDSSFTDLNDSRYATFELRRYVHTEYRDLSQMSDSDRTADPITITVKYGDTVTDTLEVQPNVGLYLAGNFAPHDSAKAVTFTADNPVRLPNGSRVTNIIATAEGSNMGNSLVRSGVFYTTRDTVIQITAGADNLVPGNMARILDTNAGNSPMPDRTFAQTIRLDSSNNWQDDLSGLIRSETSSDGDDREAVTIYDYFFVETESNPEGYAQYFRSEGGEASTVLSGDSDHRIETNEDIIALNGPANRLIVKKMWRGVPNTTGFPTVTFTLYQTWADGNEGWVYENAETQAHYEHIELPASNPEWICPEILPTTRMDGTVSRAVKYYVIEDVRYGLETDGNLTTSWQFYYYLNSDGTQTNAGAQGYFAGLTGSSLAQNGGTITICNKLDVYVQLDIQKQFFDQGTDGSWDNITSHSEMKRSAVLGFVVLRAIKTSDGRYINARGEASDTLVWMNYGDEILCGYDENGNAIVQSNNANGFWLRGEGVGGDWHFRIEDNQGDANNVNAGGSGLPKYGFYVLNGESIPVEYEYTFRETNVYRDMNRTPYPDWDWYSSILPGKYNKVFSGQDNNRVANFKASDLQIVKEWDGEPSASEVYVKLWRTAAGQEPEDFTAVIAEDVRQNQNWQMYLSNTQLIDTDHAWLILKDDGAGQWGTSLKVSRALVGSLTQNSNYSYYIQEVAYKTLDGKLKTNVNGAYKPLYDKYVNGAWTNEPVGMNEYESNSITIGEKGSNKLKVINRSTPATNYTVTKSFAGSQSSTGAPSSVSGHYPTDGSAQVVVKLQQRHRYEKTENDVEYVSADNETWVPADSEEAENTWAADWQNAESANPVYVTLPQPKPEGSILTDVQWYGSAAAWSYTWEGLALKKDTDAGRAQLYYRAVETGDSEWLTMSVPDGEQDGHKALDDSHQTAEEINSEKNSIINTQVRRNLQLNKEWTGLGTGDWPAGYVVSYQIVQHYHLVSMAQAGEDTSYSYGSAFKSVGMSTYNLEENASDRVHPQATGTLEEDNHNLNITGLPLYGFLKATDADVAEAAEAGVTLTEGTTYAVAYTYSVTETGVTKDGEPVAFEEQTVDAETTENETGGKIYTATLVNDTGLTSIKVQKLWNDAYDHSEDTVTVQLYRSNQHPEGNVPVTNREIVIRVPAAGFSGGPRTDMTGGSITVTITGDDNSTRTATLTPDEWRTAVEVPDIIAGTDTVIHYTVTVTSVDGDVISSAIVTGNDTVEAGGTVNLNAVMTEEQTGPETFTLRFAVDQWQEAWGTWNHTSAPSDGYFNVIVRNENSGAEATVRLDNSNGWGSNYAGLELDKTMQDGTSIRYTFRIGSMNSNVLNHVNFASAQEVLGSSIAGNDYTVHFNGAIKEQGGNDEDNITITASVTGWVSWPADGNQYYLSHDTDTPPSSGKITVQVKSSWNNDAGTIELSAENNWRATVTINQMNLAGYANGERISNAGCTSELPIEGAEASYSNGVINVTGYYPESEAGRALSNIQARRSLMARAPMRAAPPARKTFPIVGIGDKTPEDAETVGEPVALSDGNWDYLWDNLPTKDDDGNPIYYYVKELSANVNGLTESITASYEYELHDEEDARKGYAIVKVTNTTVRTEPVYGSVQITKTFVGIAEEMLPENYMITATWGDESRELTISGDQAQDVTRTGNFPSYTWTISQLELDTLVTFTETGYEVDGYTVVTWPEANEATGVVQTISTAAENPEAASFTNTYTKLVDVRVIKHKGGTETPIAGVEFKLERTDDSNWATQTETTNGNGSLLFTELPDGEYRITEMAPPPGYIPLASAITFTIANGQISEESSSESNLVTYTAATEETPATFTVDNQPGVALPSTGGEGTTPYILTGIALMALAGMILLDRKRKAHK